MIGFYVVNKPTSTNSTKIVTKIKHITKQKCGHLGTLDPLASGVLPVAVGKATKLFDYFLNKDKNYFAIGLFGAETDTLDSDGKIIKRQNIQIEKSQIDAVLPQFVHKIKQIPPLYSAIKVDGKRAYDIAREGKEAAIESREVEIFNLSVEQKDTNLFAFNIHCSSGTYVRTLISDIAKSVGTVATTVCIIRESSGPFTLDMSSTIEEVENGNAKLYAIDEIIDLDKKFVDNITAKRLLSGQTLITNYESGDMLVYSDNKLLGIAQTTNRHTKIKINMWEEDK